MPITIVIEPAVELPSSLPGSYVHVHVHGRLILTASTLYFIHGWDVKLGPLRLPRRTPPAHAGQQMLDQYADRSPEQQAEIIPSSQVWPITELSSARDSRWPPRLIVTTRRRGETLVYRIPRAMVPAVKRWIADYAS